MLLLPPITELHAVADSAASSAAALPVTFLAGALARAGRDITLHPLDTVKTRRQKDLPWRWSASYAGLVPNLLIGLPAGGAYFALNAFALDTLAAAGVDDRALQTALAAATAAAGHWLIRTPGEFLKTRAQADVGGAQADALRARAQIRDEGLGSLWTGLGITLFRSIPFEILRLSIYAYLLHGAFPDDAALCGLTAGASAALLTQPLDTVKTRRQTEAAPASGAPRPSLLATAVAILDEADGNPAALWSGAPARMASAGASSAVLFGLFQALMRALST